MIIQTSKIQDEHFAKIVALNEECIEEDKFGIPIYKHLLKKDRILPSTILEFEDDTLTGFLACFFFQATTCEISLFIKPGLRKQKKAWLLLRHIYPLIAQQNIKYVDFSVPQNHPIHNYLKEHNFHYENSEYEMTRESAIAAEVQNAKDLKIRAATPKDMNTILELDSICFGVQQNSHLRMMEFFNEVDNKILLLEKNSMPIGKAHIHIYKNYARLTDICIAPAHQGKGYGKFVIASAINYLRKQHINKILLEVEAKNENALKIYKGLGFKITNAYDFWRISINHLGKMISLNYI